MTTRADQVSEALGKELSRNILTLGELVEIAEREKMPLSRVVAIEAMSKEGRSFEELLSAVMAEFNHNFEALDIGLTWGKSFLLGPVSSDLARQPDNALVDDTLINRAIMYTLAAEVGNHEVGLNPCAGTGDSCPYTGLLRALREEGYSQEQVALAATLILKVGSQFRVAKSTTGCNMEGYGAGAAATAAALTDLRGGSARQAARAMVLALSPTIAVPCTPRVMVSGLCATHIGGAILMGNLAANLVLKTTLPVDVDVDVMIAMAAKVHVQAAPVITSINLEYLQPYFKKSPGVEAFVSAEVREADRKRAENIVEKARGELRKMLATSQPLTSVLGDVVIGGSSIAVGSPTNMARIAHSMIKGKITRIEIDLTADLFARRAINVPAILMGAIYGARTDDLEMYRKVLDLPEVKEIEIVVDKVDIPEVQRIRIRATEKSAWLDARNRGGGRVGMVAAKPSLEEALEGAKRLGIQTLLEERTI